MARRDGGRIFAKSVTEEQRSQPPCPAARPSEMFFRHALRLPSRSVFSFPKKLILQQPKRHPGCPWRIGVFPIRRCHPKLPMRQKSVWQESGESEHIASANRSSIALRSSAFFGFFATRTDPIAFASAISFGDADAGVSRTNGIFLNSASSFTHARRSTPESPSTRKFERIVEGIRNFTRSA